MSLYSRNALTFGVGGRLPIGKDNASSDDITLAEDLQPSTGAFGTILWAYAARALNEPASARIYTNVSYTSNGDNDRDYQFGNEFSVGVGASYQTQFPWGFNAELLYRSTERDKRAKVNIPNTGGQWHDLVPAAQFHLTETAAVRLTFSYVFSD